MTDTETTEARPQARAWLHGDHSRVLGVVLLWQAILIGVALLFGPVAEPGEGAPKTGLGSTYTLFAHTFRWDAGSYAEIAQHAYTTSDITLRAFYPVFPICVWIVRTLSFGSLDVLTAGFLINTIATWLAVVALLKIARVHFTGTRAPWLVVAAFLTAPAAFFLHSFYSEAVFCALGFWAYLFALRRQWLWMGLCLIPLTASRITAAVFVGLCFLEFWRSKDWKLRGLVSPNLLWFPAAFLGLGAVMTYMKVQTGSATAGFDALKTVPGWAYHHFNPNIFATGLREAKITARTLLGFPGMDPRWALISHALPFIGLVLLFACSVYVFLAWGRDGLPLALFGIASIVMLTINDNVVSVHRYLLPCVVMYLALVLFGERNPRLRWLVYVALYTNSLIGAGLFLSFVTGVWAG